MAYVFRLRQWELRQLSAVHRVSKPTRAEKARRLGYKAIQGVSIFRVRIRCGGRKRRLHKGIVHGKPRNQGVNEQKHFRNLRSIAEERVGRRCGNLRLLNSYWVAEDGSYKWFEVIMVDPQHNAIRRNPTFNWICESAHRHRELRGITSAGRKGRGLHKRSYGTSHIRPSKAAFWRRTNTTSLRRFR
eukprot:gnl/Ergobibamus_cyprinoides/2024.p1 GENE.gnl/Ergobibamus_cyprinoides/2024~~gnl/Ergobibamus_cyprinoides/2024.p1  ORF type:complete len:208 (+),score=83.90 gnl/Ergobibamus_cyprinoides/2024:64-624(+)